jgi:hypothetical protein
MSTVTVYGLAYIMGLLLLHWGYRSAGPIFERNFNTINDTKGSGVVSETIVFTFTTLLCLLVTSLAVSRADLSVTQLILTRTFGITSFFLSLMALVNCTFLGPKDVLSRDTIFQAMKGAQRKAASRTFRGGYFIYGLFSVVIGGFVIPLGLVSFMRMFFTDRMLLSTIQEGLPVYASGAGIIKTALYAEHLLGHFQAGLLVLGSIMDHYLLVGALLCVLFFTISGTNIWRVYTEYALHVTRWGIAVVFLLFVPLVVSVAHSAYTGYIHDAGELARLAAEALYASADASALEASARANEIRLTIGGHQSLWGFVSFLFSSGGMMIVLLQVFAVIVRNQLRKRSVAELILPGSRGAGVLQAILLQHDHSTSSYLAADRADPTYETEG